jgi:hypothetical protein
VFEGIPFEQRITHPGSHGFPDATFDYLFGKNVRIGKPVITQTNKVKNKTIKTGFLRNEPSHADRFGIKKEKCSLGIRFAILNRSL